MTEEAARTELLSTARALQLLPLQYIAWLRGVAFRRHLGDVTGLSQARLSNSTQQLRPGRRLKAVEHAKAVYRNSLAKAGLTETDVETTDERMRELVRAGGNTWAAFWRGLDHPLESELDPCVAMAIELDKLITAVVVAAEGSRIEEARAAFAHYSRVLELPTEVVALEGKPGLSPADWCSPADWVEVTLRAGRLLEAAYFDAFAHVDAIWGHGFFGRLHPRPVFELVAPKRRGETGVDKPVRRLLQVCYALHQWARHRTWPTQPPRPAELAEVFELRSQDVSNLFDGTTSLNYEQFEKRWPRFATHFGLQHNIPFPAPLVAVAICWQQNLVQVTAERKLSSFIVLDEGYAQLWRWRRSQVASQSTGTEPWATWMDD